MLTTIIGIDPRFEFSSTQQAVWCRDGPFPMHPFRFNQEIPRSLLRGYLAKGRGGRNRGVSPTMPFRLIPRSLLRGGFISIRLRREWLIDLQVCFWRARQPV